MESKTEISPASEGDPEPSPLPAIVGLYAQLGDRAPSIMWVEHWAAWVRQGDIPPSQFDSLQSYLDEFPFHVQVTENCIVVTDPGFGNGAIEWTFWSFQLHNGNPLVVLTETDAQADSSESKIWIAEWMADEWMDLTDIALPEVMRSDFFGPQADPRVLEDYELVSLQYALAPSDATITVHPMPNAAFECRDGVVDQEDIGPAEAAQICEAWESFRPEPLSFSFDANAGKFLRNRHQANFKENIA